MATLYNKVAQFEADADLTHKYVHGPSSGPDSVIPTESGELPTLAKQRADLAAELGADAAVSQSWANAQLANEFFVAANDSAAIALAARDLALGASAALATALGAKDTIALGRTAAGMADNMVFWALPNATDGLTRISCFRRLTSTTQSFVGDILLGSEFDVRFGGTFELDLFGYAEATIDAQGRILKAVSDDEGVERNYLPMALPSVLYKPGGDESVSGNSSVSGNQSVGGNSSVSGSLTQGRAVINDIYEDDLFGYIDAEVDSTGRLLRAVGDDGMGYSIAIPVPVAGTSTNEIAQSANWVAYLQETVNDSGLAAVVTSDQAGGKVREIAAAGKNIRLRITADEKYATWMQSQSGILVPVFAPLAGGGTLRAVKPPRLGVQWGDSFTQGSGSTSVPNSSVSRLSGLLGISISNQGIGGQDAKQIAARMGAVPITLTVTGGTIAAAGPVGCTVVTPAFITSPATTAAASRPGWLITADGTRVLGVMSKDTANAYSFTRDVAGTAIPAAAGVTFEIDDVNDLAGRVTVIAAGTNGTDADETKAHILAMVAHIQRLDKRYMVQNLTCGVGEEVGTTGYIRKVTVLNPWMAAMFGSRLIDVRGALQAQPPTNAQDELDLANGITMASLRADTLHWNDAGHLVAGTQGKATSDACGLLSYL